MKTEKWIIGNWKMNGSVSLLGEMMKEIRNSVEKGKVSCQIAICPPFTLLSSLQEAVKSSSVALGAQNVYLAESGAYTGETSVLLLKEFGTTCCIVGHSERRAYFQETDDFIRQKVEILLSHGIRPVLCVGETLEQREQNLHESTVTQQLSEGLKGISAERLTQCLVAYEPVWAIGTGKTATPEQANQMHQVLRKQLEKLSSAKTARAIPILYGGSVNNKNAQELLHQPEINGALVGGASLKPMDFCQIIHACQ
ncbi:triose-phosphate isomerase [Deltaproteobacteria bacterium TL4]